MSYAKILKNNLFCQIAPIFSKQPSSSNSMTKYRKMLILENKRNNKYNKCTTYLLFAAIQ